MEVPDDRWPSLCCLVVPRSGRTVALCLISRAAQPANFAASYRAVFEEITAGGSLPPRDDDAGLLPPPISGQGLVSIGVEAGTEQQAGQAASLSPKNHWPPAARQKEKREKPPQLQAKTGRSQSNQSRVPAMDQGSVDAAAIEARGWPGQVPRHWGAAPTLALDVWCGRSLTKDIIARMIADQKANKDHSGKLAAVSAVLDQLSVDTLKSSDTATLCKFCEFAHHWAKLAATELTLREDKW